MSSNPSRGQRCRAWILLTALAAIAAALPVPGGAAPAAAAGPVKQVTCALPYVTGGPNFTCSGTHKILYTAAGFTNNNATITADLVALDEQGNALGSLRVHSGDLAMLTSNTSLKQLKLGSKQNTHTMVAPVPVLRVTADDGVDKVTAYCSILPFARVFEPDGAVVSDAQGGVTHVLAAIPQVDPAHLVVKVDGVDVLAALGIGHPKSCTPAAPCGGTFNVGANLVTVADLVVETAAINVQSSNTLSFDISGLGCGGHLFTMNGVPLPGSRPKLLAGSCHKDAIADKGLSSGFAVTITKPTPGQSGVAVPVSVQGEVCSGRPIAALNVCRQNVPVAGQSHTPGNGTTSADTFKLPFNVSLSETDLAQDFATGDAACGADPGSNLLAVSATDDEGNRAFQRVIYATHTTGNPGVDVAPLKKSAASLAQQALQKPATSFAHKAVTEKVLSQIENAALSSAPFDVANAFVIGLSPAAIQQQFDTRCKDPVNGVAVKFAQSVTQNILATPDKHKDVSDPVCCTADTTIHVTSVDVANPTANITCTTTLNNGSIHVAMDLPSIVVHTHAGGSCGDSIAGIDVSVDATTTISGIKLSFDVTAAQIQNNTTPPPNATTFISGSASTTTTGGASANGICAVLDFLVTAFTFGLVDLTPSIDVTNVSDFAKQVGNATPDPLGVKEIKVDEEVVANFDQTLSGTLTSVTITPGGLLAGLKGSFSTNALDPDVQITPGALLTLPPLPTMPVTGNQDAFIAVADDTLNMLFASMTLAGKLKTSCLPSGKKLGDLLPADCETLTNPGGANATALAQGVCHGIRLHSCENLTGSSNLVTALKQGACHGTRGDNCSNIQVPAGAIAAAAERNTCANTPNFNLNQNQNILLCLRQDVPPRLALLSGGGATPVHSAMRLNGLSVALVLDRQGNGIDGDLADTPQCFATGAPRVSDCSLSEACLDLNFNFDMKFQTCTDGKPGFVSTFTGAQTLNRQAGVLCSGAGLATDDSTLLTKASTDDIVADNLPKKAQDAAPPICAKGLDLGQFVTCGTPQLLTIETDGNAAFKDYLGVTCKIQ